MAVKNRDYLYGKRGTSYINGNAARNLNAVPDTRVPAPRRVPTKQPRRQPKKQPRGLGVMTLGSLFVLTLAIIATLYLCVDYLQLHSEVTSLESNNKNLERTLTTLTNKNDATYEQINKENDLAYIYQVAVEELGMVYPDNNVVVSYKSADGSYVRQYKDIPD